MRAAAPAALAILIVAACEPQTVTPTPSPHTATAQVTCRLPVYWAVNTADGPRVHAAFVTAPQAGALTDAGIIPPRPRVIGATFRSAKWIAVDSSLLSPDGSRYAYALSDESHGEVHVVDVASGADRIAYSSRDFYSVVAFAEADAIYLAHEVGGRQGVYENLFRLDPAGGTPRLVAGSDRHMSQSGWTLIAGSAAWGLDSRATGGTTTYDVMRLDLASGVATQWFEGPADRMEAPIGMDIDGSLYVSDGYEVFRVAKPGQAERILHPLAQVGGLSFAGFMSDGIGAWFGWRGAVWLYRLDGSTTELSVPSGGEIVFPAGPCS